MGTVMDMRDQLAGVLRVSDRCDVQHLRVIRIERADYWDWKIVTTGEFWVMADTVKGPGAVGRIMQWCLAHGVEVNV